MGKMTSTNTPADVYIALNILAIFLGFIMIVVGFLFGDIIWIVVGIIWAVFAVLRIIIVSNNTSEERSPLISNV